MIIIKIKGSVTACKARRVGSGLPEHPSCTQGEVYMYKCLNCGKEVKLDLKTAKKIICPRCGYRILSKTRPKIGKRVIAR